MNDVSVKKESELLGLDLSRRIYNFLRVFSYEYSCPVGVVGSHSDAKASKTVVSMEYQHQPTANHTVNGMDTTGRLIGAVSGRRKTV
jgi:hypothetical protein